MKYQRARIHLTAISGLGIYQGGVFTNEFLQLFYDGGPCHIETKSIDWFLFDRNLCHERVNKHAKSLKNTRKGIPNQHTQWQRVSNPLLYHGTIIRTIVFV